MSVMTGYLGRHPLMKMLVGVFVALAIGIVLALLMEFTRPVFY